MKTHNMILRVLAAALALVAVTSCQEKLKLGFTKGKAVEFSASTVGSSLGTKAAYSGETAGNKERIDWQEGDMIRIYCAQVSEPDTYYSDYMVNEVITGEGATSTAHLHQVGEQDKGLRWGDVDVKHEFYAAYPSPRSGGITSKVVENIVTGSLAPEQNTLSGSLPSGGNEVTPDLKWMMMTATTSITQTDVDAWQKLDGEKVFLSFVPLTTAIKFTITNKTGAALKLAAVSLKSADYAINGEFTADLDPDQVAKPASPMTGVDYIESYPKCTVSGTLDDTRKENKISFSSPVTVAEDGTLTFTFFVLPTQHFDDLTFKLYKDDTSWMQTRLGYTDGSGVLFPMHKKTTVKGIFVPEGAQWTVKYAPDVDPWNPGGGNVELMPEVSGYPIVTSWDTGFDDKMRVRNMLLDGKFSISSTEYVQFSRGNLYCTDKGQYVSPRYAFDFEANQFDFRSRNAKTNDQAVIGGKRTTTPSSTSGQFQWLTSNSSAEPNDLASYGAFSELTKEGAKGLPSDILNYGLCMGAGSEWYNLSGSEYFYLINSRPNAAKLRKWCNVCGVNGLLLAPDVENTLSATPEYLKDYTTQGAWEVAVATYNLVFLPAAGYLCCHTDGDPGDPVGVNGVGSVGYYYSSSSNPNDSNFNYLAYYLDFNDAVAEIGNFNRNYGRSVRLVKKFEKPVPTVEFVDLDLPSGKLWADRNVGASKPEEYGAYFAWGDVEGQFASTNVADAFFTDFRWNNTPFNNNNPDFNETYFNSVKGTVCPGGILAPEYDAVHVNWGGTCRMPTDTEFKELINNTNREWTNSYDGTGVSGYIFRNKNDANKFIFLPAAGHGYLKELKDFGDIGHYWSSSLSTDHAYDGSRFHFSNSISPVTDNSYRCNGHSIRAVKDPVHD